MKITISGLRDGVPWPAAGEVMDVPESEASQLIAAGQAAVAGEHRPPDATSPHQPDHADVKTPPAPPNPDPTPDATPVAKPATQRAAEAPAKRPTAKPKAKAAAKK
jgi:hypothetical protein